MDHVISVADLETIGIFRGPNLPEVIRAVIIDEFDISPAELSDPEDFDPEVRTCLENPTLDNLRKALTLLELLMAYSGPQE